MDANPKKLFQDAYLEVYYAECDDLLRKYDSFRFQELHDEQW